MMFKRCFLHIGMEKTGTSSIQKFWVDNRRQLQDLGYFYSKAMGRDNHVNLVAYAREDHTSDNQRKRALARTGLDLNGFREKLSADFRVEAKLNGGLNLVLSNEHLQSRLTGISEKERLKALLLQVADEVDVYLYIRRQDLVAVSLYGTRLLSGGLKSFGNIFPVISRCEESPYFYNYRRIYDEYVQVFGKAHVHVRVFEIDRLVKQDVRTDFLDWIGLNELDGFKFGSRVNESISEAAQFFMVSMNVHNPAFNGTVPNILRGQVDKRISRLCGGRGRRPSRSEAMSFYDHFREENRALFKCAGLDGNFSEDYNSMPENSDVQFNASEVADVGVRLFRDVIMDFNNCKAELLTLQSTEKEKNGDLAGAESLLRQALALRDKQELRKRLEKLQKARA